MTRRNLQLMALGAVAITLASCTTNPSRLTPEQDMACDIAERLAYIDRADLRERTAITACMTTYLATTPYKQLSDARGHTLCENAFAACRNARATPAGYQKGYSHGASQMAIIEICIHYQLPGFETKPPLGEVFGKLNALADRGGARFLASEGSDSRTKK